MVVVFNHSLPLQLTKIPKLRYFPKKHCRKRTPFFTIVMLAFSDFFGKRRKNQVIRVLHQV